MEDVVSLTQIISLSNDFKLSSLSTHKLLLKSFLSLINGLGSSSSMGSYFRGENLSDFELDELNSGNDSGNDNNGK